MELRKELELVSVDFENNGKKAVMTFLDKERKQVRVVNFNRQVYRDGKYVDDPDKAAKVDGCNDMKFLVKVMIPLAGPTIISITILKLIGIWNSYMWPQLTNTQEWRLVSNWMASCGITSEGTNYPMKMAAAVIVSIPLFIVFVFFRKYIMKGVSRSGTKG